MTKPLRKTRPNKTVKFVVREKKLILTKMIFKVL